MDRGRRIAPDTGSDQRARHRPAGFYIPWIRAPPSGASGVAAPHRPHLRRRVRAVRDLSVIYGPSIPRRRSSPHDDEQRVARSRGTVRVLVARRARCARALLAASGSTRVDPFGRLAALAGSDRGACARSSDVVRDLARDVAWSSAPARHRPRSEHGHPGPARLIRLSTGIVNIDFHLPARSAQLAAILASYRRRRGCRVRSRPARGPSDR